MCALVSTMCVLRTTTSVAFLLRSHTRRQTSSLSMAISNTLDVQRGVSRMETLQTLLAKHGAPGSRGCMEANDLEPIFVTFQSEEETPELIASIMGMDEYLDLHPHLYPIARSKKTGNFVCAMRRTFADDQEMYEGSSNAPWPIVEARLRGPGMRLLALNSEHLMRRIVCECDFSGEGKNLISLYNDGLGKNSIKDKALDSPYEPGSVEKLG